MTTKKFRIPGSEIKPLATDRGGCMATDMITVQGRRVDYMYRSMPDPKSPFYEVNSGWVFLSGTESQEYLDDPANMAIYDVNTIANYDPEIIPLLDAPVGSAFARNQSGSLVPAPPPPEEQSASRVRHAATAFPRRTPLPQYHLARVTEICKFLQKILASARNSRNLTLAN